MITKPREILGISNKTLLDSGGCRARGFRNIALRAYFSVARPIVWVAATQEAPALRRMVADILASEYPEVELPNAPESPGRAGN